MAWIPGVWPGSPVLALIPISIILGVNIIREGGEDFFRYLKDRQVNHVKIQVLREDGWCETFTKDVKVGDIVKIEEESEFPADLLLISSNFEDGSCNIETANLDGESALKTRYSPHTLSTYNTVEKLNELRGWIECQLPDPHLYKFRGTIQLLEGDQIPISHQHLLLKGSKLKSSFIHGVVVYAGKDTKVARNMPKSSRIKFSYVNQMGNIFIVILFGVMAALIGLFVILNAYYQFTYAKFVPYMGPLKPIGISEGLWVVHSILVYLAVLNMFVPASLFVVLEFVKMIQARFISADNELVYHEMDVHTGVKRQVDSVAISSDLHSDLSQIDLILSDKTGTLTENEMKFNKCWVLGSDHVYDDSVKRGSMIEDLKRKHHDISHGETLESTKLDQDYFLRLVNMLNISLCHNVNVRSAKNNHHKHVYDGESSDEVALVIGASHNGFVLEYFSEKKTILSIFEKEYTFERLAEISFTPDRKRMSVIFRIPPQFLEDFPVISQMASQNDISSEESASGIVMCFTKGADTFMYPLVENVETIKATVQEKIHEFSVEGLRSLVFCFKFIGNECCNEWLEMYKASKSTLDHDKQVELNEKLEKSMEVQLHLSGVTGIEDK